MLIAENKAAFTSLRRIFNAWPSPQEVGWLAYGKGDQLIASLPTCLESFAERAHPITDLLLYTDLDLDGLECAQLAAERAQAAGLPPLRPAAGLYRALFERSPRAVPSGDAGRIRAAVCWLPAPYAGQAVQLLLSGQVMRQEALPCQRYAPCWIRAAACCRSYWGNPPTPGRHEQRTPRRGALQQRPRELLAGEALPRHVRAHPLATACLQPDSGGTRDRKGRKISNPSGLHSLRCGASGQHDRPCLSAARSVAPNRQRGAPATGPTCWLPSDAWSSSRSQ